MRAQMPMAVVAVIAMTPPARPLRVVLVTPRRSSPAIPVPLMLMPPRPVELAATAASTARPTEHTAELAALLTVFRMPLAMPRRLSAVTKPMATLVPLAALAATATVQHSAVPAAWPVAARRQPAPTPTALRRMSTPTATPRAVTAGGSTMAQLAPSLATAAWQSATAPPCRPVRTSPMRSTTLQAATEAGSTAVSAVPATAVMLPRMPRRAAPTLPDPRAW